MFLDFDELGAGSGEVIKAALRLFQFGEVGGRKLPSCVGLGASTNDVCHGSGVTGLFEPMKDRFHSIINLSYDVDSVVSHGLSRGWDPTVISWIRNKGMEAFDWKPSRDMQRGERPLVATSIPVNGSWTGSTTQRSMRAASEKRCPQDYSRSAR